MQRDRQAVVVDPPQLLEQQFRLAARVDEHQRHAVMLLDGLVDLRNRVARRMAAPGYPLLDFKDGDDRAGPAGHGDRARHLAAGGLRHQPALQLFRIRTVAERPIAAQTRRQLPQPGERQREQMCPRFEAISECNSSKHYIAQVGKRRSAWACAISSTPAPALSAGYRAGRCAGGAIAACRRSGFRSDRQAHLLDRRRQVAVDVDGKRLERRDVERMERRASACPVSPCRAGRDRSASAENRPASCPPRSARSAASISRLRPLSSSSS
jgi:hypothetical protein